MKCSVIDCYWWHETKGCGKFDASECNHVILLQRLRSLPRCHVCQDGRGKDDPAGEFVRWTDVEKIIEEVGK